MIHRCMFCRGALERGLGYHIACDAEFDRRAAEGRCTICGNGAAAVDSWCVSCDAESGPRFASYPGGR